jgi:hypothetical protein
MKLRLIEKGKIDALLWQKQEIGSRSFQFDSKLKELEQLSFFTT